ncbi:hypothetical protein EV702DRAFT_1274879 [Suillus placidus]|uniref:Uncharacterized protein n=1 Tax=Suillus placidus TaxID=48579 RepID=A0A9P7A4I5_9AGAM|nr:hypothetical protein EV702DRAFT_1274879 [Suillus placidus]
MTFHPHVRTRLLLGLGCDILVYDVARPSAPVKPINIGQDVVDTSCSPFSKMLVAVASTDSVGLVDLDKDKGLFKTVSSPQPITSITFLPEGAAIYLGVVCLAVQKRLKASPSAVKPSNSNSSAASSPAHARAKAASNSSIAGTPKKQDALETGTSTRRVSNRSAFSPSRNPISPRCGRGTDSSTTGVLRTRVSTSRENIFDDATDTPMRSNTRAASSQKSTVLDWPRCARVYRERQELLPGSSARSEITRTSSNLSLGTKTKGSSSLKRAPSTTSVSSSKTRDSARSKTPTNEDEDARTDLLSPDLPMDPITNEVSLTQYNGSMHFTTNALSSAETLNQSGASSTPSSPPSCHTRLTDSQTYATTIQRTTHGSRISQPALTLQSTFITFLVQATQPISSFCLISLQDYTPNAKERYVGRKGRFPIGSPSICNMLLKHNDPLKRDAN